MNTAPIAASRQGHQHPIGLRPQAPTATAESGATTQEEDMTDAEAPAPAGGAVAQVEGAIEGAVKTAETIGATIWNDIQGGVTILKDEAQKAINWVNTEVPGAGAMIQGVVVEAEQDAAALAKMGENGMDGAIAAGAQDLETLIANFMGASNLTGNAGAEANGLSSSAVTVGKTVLTQMLNVAFLKVIGGIAPAIAAAL